MAPQYLRRPFKRAMISNQQRLRELSLQCQAQHRHDAQHQAHCLASFLNPYSDPEQPEPKTTLEPELEPLDSLKELDVCHASKLKGAEARKWFARQLMLPEWILFCVFYMQVCVWFQDFTCVSMNESIQVYAQSVSMAP